MGRLPRELLAMQGDEWELLAAYAELEPFGPVRDDLRAAEAVCATLNAWGGRARPEHVFATLRPAESARAGGAGSRSGFVAICPALSPVSA
jgi:hypothetical protein